MKQKILIALLTLTVAGAAFANPGGHPGPGPAGEGRGEGGPHGDGFGPGFGGPPLLVSSTTGSVYIIRESATTADTHELVGISSAGATLFTVNLGSDRPHLLISGANLLSVSSTEASDGTVTSTITARSGSTGATVWTRTLTGRVGPLTPFNGGTYAVVTIPAATSGGTATRSLVAIGNDGSVLWTVTL